MRFRLDLAYDGAGFHGWAAQPELRTVEGVVRDLLARITRQDVTLTCAGRTDAGVHARGQVAHCDLDAGEAVDADGAIDAIGAIDAADISRRLARMLPDDITVWSVRPVSTNFDARFSATQRHYVYRMCDDRSRLDPIRRHHIAVVHKPLDTDAMNAAARYLTGEHDFAAFCKQRDGATTIRTLDELTTSRTGAVIETSVRADAFCHSMIRALMGALTAVGHGRFEPQWAGDILAAGIRDPRVKVMAARGLTLERVDYPDQDQWAERAATTRRRRDELPGE